MSQTPLNDAFSVRVSQADGYPALLELWTTVFNQPEEIFTGTYASVSPEKRFACLVEQDGKPVASVQVFILPIRDESGEPVPVGCIANVSTQPEFRGRQYSSAILKAVIAELEVRGAAWSYLFTGIPDFYARLGWRQMKREVVSGDVRSFASGLPTQSPVTALPELYASCQAKTPFSLVRTPEEWRLKLPRRLAGKVQWVTPDQDSYALGQADDGSARIEEWGSLTESVSDYRALLEAASNWAVEQGFTRLRITSSRTVAATQAIAELFPNATYEADGCGMARPISGDWSIERLESGLSLPSACFFGLDGF